MPQSCAVVISNRLATLYELSTSLGLGDLYDLLEIIAVDNHNKALDADNH